MYQSYPRYRTKGNFTDGALISHRVKQRTCAELNWVDFTGYKSSKVGEIQTMMDIVTPSFYKRSKEGEIIINPMTRTRLGSFVDDPGMGPAYQSIANSCNSPVLHQVGEMNSGGWLARLVTGDGESAIGVGSNVLSGSEKQNLLTEVSTRCLSERGKGENNLFESLAEYKQTIGMFSGALNRFNRVLTLIEKAAKTRASEKYFRDTRVFDRVFRSQLRDIVRGVPSPASAYLAVRYGLIPLIRDVQGIMSGLKKKVGKVRKTTRAFGKIQRYNGTISTYTNAWAAGVYDVGVMVETTDSIEVRAMSIDEYFATVYSNVGFTEKGLATVPWELVTLSFVADWFVNIGDLIGALVPAPGYNQLGSCLVVTRDTQTVYTPTGTSPRSGQTVTRQLTGAIRGVSWSRTRQPLSKPGLVIKADFGFDRPTRVLDALALTIQRVAKFIK